MPRIIRAIGDEFKDRLGRKDVAPINSYQGFTGDGRVVLRDRRGTSRAEVPQAEEKGFGAADPLAIYKPTGTKQVDAAKAMASFTGWTYAAVNAIASEVSNIQLRLYRVDGKDHVELDDHDLLDLLDMPNEAMTGIELKYAVMAHLELAGNAYLLMDGAKDASSPPRAIYPLDPGRMRVQLDKGSFPYRLSHYEFTLDGKVYRFEPWQVVHLKYPDPSDPFVGIGIPQTIPTWIDSDNYAMEYNRKFFVNGANIGLYIQTDTNVEANIDRIRAGFSQRQAGVENAHKTPVLPKGAKLEHTGVTQRDMDFAKLTDATRDRILAGFRVSKTILGTAESDTNRSTAETADYVFSKRTIKPKMDLVIAYLNAFLVPRFGEDLYLTFIDPVAEDRAARTMEMTAASGGVPLMTQNEARRSYLGLGPVDGGDKLLIPTNLTESGATSTPEGEDQTPQLSKAVTAAGWRAKAFRPKIGGAYRSRGIGRVREALKGAFEKAFERKEGYRAKSVTDLTHDEYLEHWKRFSDRSERANEELKRVFEGINAKQREQVIENLPEATGVEKSVGELYDLKEWIGITINLATPILTSLARDEAAAALAMIGAQGRDLLANDAIRAALDRGIAKMARSYNETTLEQLKQVIGEKLTQPGGTNLAELTEAVDGVYSFADERRAGLIAKTESYRAGNWANREAWKASGVVKSLMWFTAEDDHVCPQCQSLDGTTVAIDAKFFEDGYSDGETPPRHPDCRCYVRPEEIAA